MLRADTIGILTPRAGTCAPAVELAIRRIERRLAHAHPVVDRPGVLGQGGFNRSIDPLSAWWITSAGLPVRASAMVSADTASVESWRETPCRRGNPNRHRSDRRRQRRRPPDRTASLTIPSTRPRRRPHERGGRQAPAGNQSRSRTTTAAATTKVTRPGRHVRDGPPAPDRGRSDDFDGNCIRVSGERFDIGSVASQDRPPGVSDCDNECVHS